MTNCDHYLKQKLSVGHFHYNFAGLKVVLVSAVEKHVWCYRMPWAVRYSETSSKPSPRHLLHPILWPGVMITGNQMMSQYSPIPTCCTNKWQKYQKWYVRILWSGKDPDRTKDLSTLACAENPIIIIKSDCDISLWIRQLKYQYRNALLLTKRSICQN